MRVALELQPCGRQMTGIGHYTYELVKRLIPTEEMRIQGNLFNFAGRLDNKFPYDAMPFPVVENRFMAYGVFRRLWRFLPVDYEAFFGEADVTHFFNYIVPPRISGKVITTVHDMTHVRFPETVDKRNLRRLRQGLDYSLARSELIMTSSAFSKREIVELCGIPEEKITVVYPAPSISGGTCDKNELFHRFGIVRSYLLYVGSIEPRKNLSRLLMAYQKLRDARKTTAQLVLCGGNGWNNEQFYETLAKVPYHDDVVITGYVTAPEKNTLLANADAFVFPSLYEGFGMPPLEAMYWGTPVVCSNAASLPEAAGEAACYVDPLSVESIAEGIERVISDKVYARQLVEAGKNRCRQFDWDDSAEKLEWMYRSIREGTI